MDEGWVVIRQTYMAVLFLGELWQSAKSEGNKYYYYDKKFRRNDRY